MRQIVCNESNLSSFVSKELSKYVQIKSGSSNLWSDTSAFLCNLSPRRLTDLSNSFANDFALPKNIREVIYYTS